MIKRLIEIAGPGGRAISPVIQMKQKLSYRKRMNFDDAYMEIIWPRYQFSLSLDQSLITAMEDEARWMIKNNLTSEKQVPDFLNYIYVDGLKAVKPKR